MRLTEEQMKQSEIEQTRYSIAKKIFDEIGECKTAGDCYQEDGSVIHRKGDIVISSKYFDTLSQKYLSEVVK